MKRITITTEETAPMPGCCEIVAITGVDVAECGAPIFSDGRCGDHQRRIVLPAAAAVEPAEPTGA